MTKEIFEVAFKLSYKLAYYQKILAKCGAINTFNCETHDLYYTNKDLTNLTEIQMKKSCIRYRMVKGLSGRDFNGSVSIDCHFQNYQVFASNHTDNFSCPLSELKAYEELFAKSQYHKVFDTSKKDYQYQIGNIESRIQLQDIKGIGLVLYYDNPLYYSLPLATQRQKLISELRSYGFTELNDETPNLDKLRTLYYQKECYSLPPNN